MLSTIVQTILKLRLSFSEREILEISMITVYFSFAGILKYW